MSIQKAQKQMNRMKQYKILFFIYKQQVNFIIDNKNQYQMMHKKASQYVIQEQDYDPAIWQRAQIKNNSGYLDQQYQTTQQFPSIPDYHFRIQDDHAILQLQKISLNDKLNQPVNFNQASNKFQDKLSVLLQGLSQAKSKNEKTKNILPIQTHGYYSLDKQYDDEAAIKQAFSRIQVNQIQDKIKQLSIEDKKPKFIKKVKLNDKMKNQGATPVSNLTKQFNKLTISQQDL